jgi:FixJ family two-component response regulator
MNEAMVYVVDDDASVRKALGRLLQSAGFQAITYDSSQALLDQETFDGAGCIILDVHLPGLNGLELQAELALRQIHTPIIFITGCGDIPMSVKAMKGGALDFLTKPFQDQELLNVVMEAIKKDSQARLARSEKARIERHYQTLTPREQEVVKLVVKGMMNKEIAAELGASEKTIKVHRGRVTHKMGARSIAELVRAMEKIQPGTTKVQ